MDAPPLELAVRLALAVMATVAAGLLVYVYTKARTYSANPLVAFLAFVVGLNAAWRWWVLWVGIQHDADGTYAILVEPYVRTGGAALQLLLYVAVALIALFHSRRLR